MMANFDRELTHTYIHTHMLHYGPIRFDLERLSNLSINPLTCDFERFLVRSDDLDSMNMVFW